MASVKSKCGSCGAGFSFPEAYLNRQSNCTKCKERLVLRDATSPSVSSEPTKSKDKEPPPIHVGTNHFEDAQIKWMEHISKQLESITFYVGTIANFVQTLYWTVLAMALISIAMTVFFGGCQQNSERSHVVSKTPDRPETVDVKPPLNLEQSKEAKSTTVESDDLAMDEVMPFFNGGWEKVNYCQAESAIYHLDNGTFEGRFASTPREECNFIAGMIDFFLCKDEGIEITIGGGKRTIPVNWKSKSDVNSKIRAYSEFKTAICVDGVWLIYQNE